MLRLERETFIDFEHALARGLRLVALQRRAYSSGGAFPYSGYTVSSRGVQKGLTSAAGVDPSATGHTFLVVANLTAVSSDAVAFGRLRYTGGANYGAGLRFNATTLELDGGVGTSAWHYSASSSAVQTGRHVYAGAIGVGDITSTGRLWRDGALLTTGVHSATAYAASRWDGQVDLGGGTASGASAITGSISGHIESGLYYARSLQAEDVEYLSAAMLRGRLPFMRSRRIWVPVSAGVPDFTFSGSGGVQFAGSASAASTAAFTASASGGIQLGGAAAATTTFAYSFSASGGLQFAGSAGAIFDAGFVASGSGGITFVGSASYTSTYAYSFSPSGGLQLGGGATFTLTGDFVSAAAGGLQFGGAASTQIDAGFSATGSGGLQLGGTATAIESNDYVAIPSGGLTLGGDATLAYTSDFAMTAGGGMTFAGAATVSMTSSGSGTGASADEVADAVWQRLINGIPASVLVDDLHRLQGLRAGVPLSVTATRRTAGAIEQTVTDSGGAVVVERA